MQLDAFFRLQFYQFGLQFAWTNNGEGGKEKTFVQTAKNILSSDRESGDQQIGRETDQ